VIVAESLDRVDRPIETMLRNLQRARPPDVIGHMAAALAKPRDPRPLPPWLRPEQRTTCAQLLPILDRFECALLADPVGSGKTWVALGVAAVWGRTGPPVVLVPAAIQSQWGRAAATAGVPITLWSHERLSRGTLPPELESRAPGSLVIIDESHHFRNPETQRYRHLAPALVERACLLLSATPVVNTLQDLASQLALGIRDDALLAFGIASLRSHLAAPEGKPSGLNEIIVGGKEPASGKPRRLRRKEPAQPDDREIKARCERIDRLTLSQNQSIASLIRTVLWRALASSDLALLGVLRRYRSLLHQASDAARTGRSFNRATVKSLVGDASDQLILWDLMPEPIGQGDLVLNDLDLVNQLIAEAKKKAESADLKSARLAALVSDDIPTLVFAGARDTVRYLREHIPRAAWCTGASAGIGFTRMSREDVLSWFRPDAPAVGITGPTVLLTTDVTAEGLDLQRTARVVHYDLPWTAVRMDQRDGRALRLGSTHETVEVIRFELPAAIEQRLRQLGALAHKRGLPRRAGIDGQRTRLWTGREVIAKRFGRLSDAGHPLVCAVEGDTGGILAAFNLMNSAGQSFMTAAGFLDSEGSWSEDPEMVSKKMEAALIAPYLETSAIGMGAALGQVADVIQQKLRSASMAQWIGPRSSRQTGWITRLNRMATRAVQSRNRARLTTVERAMAYVRQGHTAGEEMLLEQAFMLTDAALIRQLRGFPKPKGRATALLPELIGLVMFAPRGPYLPDPRHATQDR
jgi:superfamily II DNA or RNA helicase